MAFTAGQKLRASDLNTADTYAEFNAAVSQVVPNVMNTRADFGVDNRTSPLVSKIANSPGHQFTLNRAGLWTITATLRFNGGTGERFASINANGSGVTSWGAPAANSPVTLNPSVTRYFAKNDVIEVNLFQGSGGNLSTEVNNGGAWGRINLSWIHD